MHASIGDVIEVDRNKVGTPPRQGRILAVRGEEGHEHYDVEWDDGHTSIFFPASTAHVVHPGGRTGPMSGTDG
jgi:hypothetical protein